MSYDWSLCTNGALTPSDGLPGGGFLDCAEGSTLRSTAYIHARMQTWVWPCRGRVGGEADEFCRSDLRYSPIAMFRFCDHVMHYIVDPALHYRSGIVNGHVLAVKRLRKSVCLIDKHMYLLDHRTSNRARTLYLGTYELCGRVHFHNSRIQNIPSAVVTACPCRVCAESR